MAFQPKEILIVPKGLNLLTPGDQAADGDCLQLDGFWPGSAGRLQQARGWVKKNSTSDAISIDSLCEASGKLFFGGGGKLYMGAEDGANVSSIDTGYDGNPLGMSAYQGMVWVMNRSRQKRIETGAPTPNGTSTTPGTVRSWGVPAPPTAPGITVSGGGALADGAHAYYTTVIDQWGYESNPSPATGVWCPQYPYPPGFTDGTVAVTLGSSSVVLSGATWDATIDGQQFLVPSAYLGQITAPAQSPYFLKYVDPTHATLCDIYGNALTWSGTSDPTASYVIYSLAAATSGGGGFYNSAKATISAPAGGGGISAWNVYHQSPGLNGPYLVNPSPIPIATTSYVDYGDPAHSQDDDSLLALDSLMENDHDPPPACTVMADRPYNGRLVAANSADHPNRIWFTNPLEPSYFPGSANPQAGNWVDVGNDTGDGILNISVRQGMLIVYRQRSIWRHLGDLGDSSAVLAPLIPNMGIVGPRAVVATSWGDLAVVKQGQAFGIYRVTDYEQRVSGKIEPIFTGVGAENYSPMNAAAAATCAVGFQLGRLWFSYPDGSNTTPNRTMICDIEQDQFSINIAGRWFARDGGFGCFLHGALFFLGASGQKVYSLDDGLGDQDGSAVPMAFQSRYEDDGNPDREKTWADLAINHNTQGQTLTVKFKPNKGAASLTLGTIQSNALTRQVIPIPQSISSTPTDSFNAAIQITGDGYTSGSAFTPVLIDGPMILHYFLKPRKAMQWDSGPTDHGVTGPKVVDAIEIDLDSTIPTGSGATGGVKLFLQSDVMGASLAEQSPGGSGWTFNATTGRAVLRLVFGPFTGRLYRYQLYSADGVVPFLLYRVRFRVLPVGILADGAFGDSWYTEPIAIGVE